MSSSEPGGPSDEDAVWQEIVDNYGERAQLTAEEEERVSPRHRSLPSGPASGPPSSASSSPPRPAPPPGPSEPTGPPASYAGLPGGRPGGGWEDEEEGYRPPPPPAVPLPRRDRLVAWVAMFGSPTVALVLLLLAVSMPAWLGCLLLVGFVGGLVYLVATMSPSGPRDEWDDGAQV